MKNVRIILRISGLLGAMLAVFCLTYGLQAVAQRPASVAQGPNRIGKVADSLEKSIDRTTKIETLLFESRDDYKRLIFEMSRSSDCGPECFEILWKYTVKYNQQSGQFGEIMKDEKKEKIK